MEKKLQNTEIPLLNMLIDHNFKRPGKNIRAQLMMALSQHIGQSPFQESFMQVATIIELIHTGTLVHDDVIDQNTSRRGQLATHEVFGNTCSILLGDYLFTKAYLIAQSLPCKDLFLSDLAKTAHDLVEGEFLQLQHKKTSFSLETYLKIIGLKTSSLFSLATKSIAQLHDPSLQEYFYDIGYTFGIVFQLIDDYQDYFSSMEVLGKEPGQDFKERKLTLPILMLKKLGHDDLFEAFFETEESFESMLTQLVCTKKLCLEFIEVHALFCFRSLERIKAQSPLISILKNHLLTIFSETDKNLLATM
jgi:octaprenyl-diphosphate synthase